MDRFTHTPECEKVVYNILMARTNINLDATLIRKARKLTRLKTKRAIVNRALDLLVSETRKAILRYYGSRKIETTRNRSIHMRGHQRRRAGIKLRGVIGKGAGAADRKGATM